MHILSIIRGFDAINASKQRTMCSCMVFQPSWFILYFIFFYKLDRFSMKFSIMTSPRHVMSRICSPILMKFVQHVQHM